MAGSVRVDGRRVDKPGTPIPADAELEVVARAEPYVSRAGRKLAAALDHFAARLDPSREPLDPRGRTCLDVGASTGGFTDCLLQRGAEHVTAIDVGYGQLDHGLRQDPRVEVHERTNARHLQPGDLDRRFSLVVIDVSFISLTKVVPPLFAFFDPRGAYLLPMIKPQFEAGRDLVGKGGIVRDEAVRERVIAGRIAELAALGAEPLGRFDSPVHGATGNREAFALFRIAAETPS